MPSSPRLALPLLKRLQQSADVLHNDAIEGLDAALAGTFTDEDVVEPAETPSFGDIYLVAAAGTSGAFVGHEEELAEWRDGWKFLQSADGLRVRRSNGQRRERDGQGWREECGSVFALQGFCSIAGQGITTAIPTHSDGLAISVSNAFRAPFGRARVERVSWMATHLNQADPGNWEIRIWETNTGLLATLPFTFNPSIFPVIASGVAKIPVPIELDSAEGVYLEVRRGGAPSNPIGVGDVGLAVVHVEVLMEDCARD